MNKLKAFVRLDFMTVKPYFTAKTMLIYLIIALFLTANSENISSGIGVGMMMSTLFMGYPFMLSEKSNMDALYVTLSVNRKTVVLGRYIFTLLLNICAIVFSLVLAAAGQLAAKTFGWETGLSGSLESVVVLSAIFIVIQSIQLALYFRLGYSKGKFFSVVPFAALMAGYLALMAMQSVSGGPARFMACVWSSGMVMPLLVAVLLLALAISYRLSLAFYQRREF